ncbi:NUDIX domain-containing protein, partial [Lacticigenium naphthae]
MKKHILVVGAIILDQDKVLCAQRSENKSLPLMWEFPGGKVESGQPSKI